MIHTVITNDDCFFLRDCWFEKSSRVHVGTRLHDVGEACFAPRRVEKRSPLQRDLFTVSQVQTTPIINLIEK